QDLLRGIDKILRPDGENSPNNNSSSQPVDINAAVSQALSANVGSNINNMLERGFITLEDEDFDKAEDIFEEVLNQDAKCAKAYMGKLLAYYKAKNANDFAKIIVKGIFLDRKNTKTLEPDFDLKQITRERYIGEDTLDDVIFEVFTKEFKEEYLTYLDFLESYNPELDYVEEYCKLNDSDDRKSVDDNKLYTRYLQYATDEDKETFDYKNIIDGLVKTETEKEEKRVNDIITKYKSKISLESINKIIDDVNKKIKDEVKKNENADFDSLEKEYKAKLSSWKVEVDGINNAYEAECERTKTHWPEICEERIKNWEAECERIQREHDDEYQKEVNAVNEWNNKLNDIYNKQLTAYNTEMANIETQLNNLIESKNKLSMFKRKEKEEIERNIDNLVAKKSNINKPTLNLKPIPNKRPVELPPKPEYSETPIMPEKPEMPLMPERDYIGDVDMEMIYIDEFINKSIDINKIKKEILEKRQEEELRSHGIEVLNSNLFRFGNYKGEALTWRILKFEKDRVLLITDKVIDIIPYNKKFENITWSECTLRKYLNNDFINTSFSNSIIKQIETVTLKNPDNKEQGTKGGVNTQDRVFCLSMDEAKTYFKDDNDRVAKPTDYAISRVKEDYLKSFLDDKTGGGIYWLRTPGYYQLFAPSVNGSGYVYDDGGSVDHDNVGIRPALWLRLDS
nr:DUF6273 domain-containing protein [Lachnospiraceae bacterium]